MGILLKAKEKSEIKRNNLSSASDNSQEQDFAKWKKCVAAFAKTTENVVHFCCDFDLDKGEKFREF